MRRETAITAKIFWLKTAPAGEKHRESFGTPAPVGSYDLEELTEELERVIWGSPPNLPPMARQQRREALIPASSAWMDVHLKGRPRDSPGFHHNQSRTAELAQGQGETLLIQ
jgi:hypothetical protein